MFFNEFHVALEPWQGSLYNLEATIRMYTEVPASGENDVVSIDSSRPSKNGQAGKPKTDVQYGYSGS